jgi:DNA-binding SARP family transcriptional activator
MVPTTDAHPPRIRIGLLGAVVAEIDGTAADLGGPRQRAVFAVLALTPNRMIATAQLVDAVWGDAPPLSAKSTLQAYISRLRRVIEPSGAATIEHSAAGYALRVDPVSVDLERFAESVRDGRRALATGVFDLAADRLGEALGHWQGEPLADLQGYAFADAERARLRNERHAVIADRIDAELAAGRHESVVAELEALVLAAPLHEPFWIRLMIALYRCDRQADALAAYQSARAALLEQLGIDPGPALAATEAAILRQDPALGVQAAAIGGAAEPRARGTVDARREGLVGREDELAALDARVDLLDRRGGLVVVSGPAGIGKTALLGAFVDRVRSRAIPVFWGRAWEGEGAPAFWLWIEVLRQWADEIGHDAVRSLAGRRLAHLTRLLPELGVDSSEIADGPVPSQAQFALYDVVAGVLTDAAERASFVIVLDDLQWADVSTVELLKFLATRLGESNVLVVATRRDPAVTSEPVAAADVRTGRRRASRPRSRRAGSAAPARPPLRHRDCRGRCPIDEIRDGRLRRDRVDDAGSRVARRRDRRAQRGPALLRR